MDRKETIALFLRGRDAWNAWAGKLLAERAALEAEGTFAAEKDWRGWPEPKTEKTRAWMEAAKADFSDTAFETASWPKMEYPVKPVQLEANRVDFDGFIFPGGAVFERVNFAGAAGFKGAVFLGAASFERATFGGETSFHSAAFSYPVSFDGAAFNASALFESVTFSASASFEDTFFRRAACFRQIVAKQTFSLAGALFMQQVPDFIGARFAQPVLLENVRFGAEVEPGSFLQSVFAGAFLWMTGQIDPALDAKYRALKRLAAQPAGIGNEQFFFRGELRSRRYAEDKPWHLAFWFGIFYELFSGFGHSMLRPILWLIALTLVSSWFYLGQHKAAANVSPRAQLQALIAPHLPGVGRLLLPASQPALTCKHGQGTPAKAALLLAIRQGSLTVPFDNTKSAQLHACLYGFDETLRAAAVPDAVMLWAIGQTALSAALLFLFLLALRNRFKIE